MPYQTLCNTAAETRLHLWPHRSLQRRGFVWFIGATVAMLSLPLIGLVGNAALWVLLPFLLAPVAAIWLALGRNQRDREIVETLTMRHDRMELVRLGPRGRRQQWQANPHWVRVALDPTGGPVPSYLTLTGGPREVELGAFLSEDERIALHREVRVALARLRGAVRD